MHTKTRFFILALLISALPALAGAESIVWNQSYATRLCGVRGVPSFEDPTVVFTKTYSLCKGFNASNPNVSVEYRVTVKNDETGAVVPTGSTVPSGTRLRYEFAPHGSTDISWFLTGGAADSPYGDWGAETPPIQCRAKDRIDGVAGGGGGIFASFYVAPPTKDIQGLNGANCTSSGSDRVCTMPTAGVYTAQFNFNPTTGKFYGRSQGDGNVAFCHGQTAPLVEQSIPTTPFIVQVPQQTISHSVTVEAPVGSPPSTPSLTGGGACTLGTPHSITMSSTDPEGDRLRYGVDWDANGSIDEYVPSSGYVNSGTSQTASRTYATAGAKTVRVLAQDEGGLSSDWATINFNCSPPVDEEDDDNDDPPPPPPPTNCPISYTLQNNTCVFTGCPSGFTLQGAACVMIITQCTANNFCIGNDLYHRNAQCTQSLVQSCLFGCSAGACLSAPSGTGNIVAQPSLVTMGGTTNVSWQTSGMESCIVTDNNPQVTTNRTGESGSFTTGSLNQQTIFTLTCDRDVGGTFTDSVTVSIVPVFIEN